VRFAKRVILGLLALVLCSALGAGYTFWHQGYRMYVIHTGSMMPTYNPGDVVIDKPVKISALHRGEAITFLHSAYSNDLVTHRIVGIKGGLINTKGDANKTPDAWHIRTNQVKGAVATHVPDLGYVVVFLKQRDGDAAVMTGFLALIFLWGLFFPSEDGESGAELIDVSGSDAEAEHVIDVRTPDEKVIDVRTPDEKTADELLAGVPRLRGRHRAPRHNGRAVEMLRSGPRRSMTVPDHDLPGVVSRTLMHTRV
jgi:signal peptidase